MSTILLIKNAQVLVTMDQERHEIADGAIFARSNVIEQTGRPADLPDLVNTHHQHLYLYPNRCHLEDSIEARNGHYMTAKPGIGFVIEQHQQLAAAIMDG